MLSVKQSSLLGRGTGSNNPNGIHTFPCSNASNTVGVHDSTGSGALYQNCIKKH